jgi:hypothetical protein
MITHALLRPPARLTPIPTHIAALERDRETADRVVRGCSTRIAIGGAVQRTGKALFVTGLAATGLHVIGLPIPLSASLGVLAAGPLLRFAGAGIALRAFGDMQKAVVRSAGLTRQIDAARTAAGLPSTPTAPARRRESGALASGIKSGVLWAALGVVPAILTARYGAAGCAAGMMLDVVAAGFSHESQYPMGPIVAAAFMGGAASGLACAGPIGTGIACAASIAWGVTGGLGVYRGKVEPF